MCSTCRVIVSDYSSPDSATSGDIAVLNIATKFGMLYSLLSNWASRFLYSMVHSTIVFLPPQHEQRCAFTVADCVVEVVEWIMKERYVLNFSKLIKYLLFGWLCLFDHLTSPCPFTQWCWLSFLLAYVRIQTAVRYHGIRGSIAANNELTDVEDRFDVLVDANDQLLERVVRSLLMS